MTKRHILLLDCTPRSEPSEGRLLSEFLKICKLFKPARAQSAYFPIKSKSEFLRKLSTRKKYDVIHISAHGSKRGSHVYIGNGRTWEVDSKEITKTPNRSKIVFLNACVADAKEMVRAFDPLKCFIAPSSHVRWDDAALFSIYFYKKLVIDGSTPKSAFWSARKHSSTSRDYQSLWY